MEVLNLKILAVIVGAVFVFSMGWIFILKLSGCSKEVDVSDPEKAVVSEEIQTDLDSVADPEITKENEADKKEQDQGRFSISNCFRGLEPPKSGSSSTYTVPCLVVNVKPGMSVRIVFGGELDAGLRKALVDLEKVCENVIPEWEGFVVFAFGDMRDLLNKIDSSYPVSFQFNDLDITIQRYTPNVIDVEIKPLESVRLQEWKEVEGSL